MWLKKYFVRQKSKEDIEAEEIFLDAEAVRSLEEKGKLEKPIRRRNFLIAYFLAAICLLGLFLRTAYLQGVKGEYYLDLAQGNKLRIYSIRAPRGIIYDSSGQALVRNAPSFDLVVSIADFLDQPLYSQEAVLEKIAGVMIEDKKFCRESKTCSSLEFSTEEKKELLIREINKRIEESWPKNSKINLFEDIERESTLILETTLNDYPGLRLEENIKRNYFLGPAFSHILGYTGEIDSQELEDHPEYSLGDRIGKSGLEYQYEEILRGEPGQEQVEVDSMGKISRLLAVKPVVPGQGLILSIEARLQQKLYDSLKEMLDSLPEASRAAAVAVNPDNGSILAMVSLPAYDNNLFFEPSKSEELNRLLTHPDQVFLNRALSGQYPPGSTVKPLIAAAALEEKIVTPSSQVNCQGLINIGSWIYRDWKTHGLTDIRKAIAESCNVFFYTIGGGYGAIKGLGVEKIAQYLRYFGLGQISQIDLPHEKAGLVPDKEWKQANGEKWQTGHTYNLSIGQGDLLVTPLQMALAVSAVANGGILYQPQLADKIVDKEKKVIKEMEEKVVRRDFISQENLQTVRQGMREAVLSGSCQRLSTLPVGAAGKTGTAQFGDNEQTHAWFVGFAPDKDPQMALAIVVEAGGEGHKAAVPVAQEVWQWYFSQQQETKETVSD